MAVRFSQLKGQADNEFNNRSHLKIMVIGGVNIADKYINKKKLLKSENFESVFCPYTPSQWEDIALLMNLELDKKLPVSDGQTVRHGEFCFLNM